ncbi:MAG: glucosyltransferase [Oscillibacter sp.]|jgi:MGT family glycosyltransferase|nr:glucosyltransferase [Oscillibacter sp.]
MSRIAFFSIPAEGHTNPTVEVVRELVRRGHEVRYYSFEMFREKLTDAGAQFVPCDRYLPPQPPKVLDRKVGKDFAMLVEMVADTTVRMDAELCAQLTEWSPACIVSDSVCFWGKLLAGKLNIPLVCSTTTFAFNRQTARLIHKGPGELWRSLLRLPRISRKMELLRRYGYPAKNLIALLQNDNETDTVVYTSRAFQPMAETFSSRYAFVGPPVAGPGGEERQPGARPLIYISLGTLVNRRPGFYRNCIRALWDAEADVVMSVGERTDRAALGELPPNFSVYDRVDQMAVLRRADVFLTHCGMNSANEAIYCGVPTVLFPQQSEEGAVAARMEELGVGVPLKSGAPKRIRRAVEQVLSDGAYRERTQALGRTFREAGGAPAAADKILKAAEKQS